MKGSLQKKHGKYYVVVYQKDENGKLHQKWIPTGIPEKGRNQTKANAALHRILTELEAQNAKSTSFLVTKLKFVEALLAWVEYKKYEIRTNTYELYTLNLNTHIIPFFEKKNKLVTEITIDDIEDYYKTKLKEGLSVETIKSTTLLFAALSKGSWTRERFHPIPATALVYRGGNVKTGFRGRRIQWNRRINFLKLSTAKYWSRLSCWVCFLVCAAVKHWVCAGATSILRIRPLLSPIR